MLGVSDGCYGYLQLLEKPKYCKIEKIKTIGSTYMAVSGMDKGSTDGPKSKSKYGHIVTMATFAFEIQKKIDTINKHSFNEFELRIGKDRSQCGCVLLDIECS